MIHLPEKLEKITIDIFGEKGKKWIKNFPTIFTRIIDLWQLEFIEPVPDLSINFLAVVKTKDHKNAILKLGVPNRELTTESEALKHHSDTITVKCLRSAPQLGSLLLEKAEPGKSLKELKNNVQETAVAAEIIKRIARTKPPKYNFPYLNNWFEKAFFLASRSSKPEYNRFKTRLIPESNRIIKILNLNNNLLLHGDLHHENILWDNKKGWIVIDPKGVIGDWRFECGRFMHNQLTTSSTKRELIDVLKERADIFAAKLNLSVSEVLMVAFLDCVLSNLWTVEDKYGNLEQDLKICDILLEMIG